MKIHYICDCCGASIDTLEVDSVDETKLGFDCLTEKERSSMIEVDEENGQMRVQSLCDACIEAMGLADPGYYPGTKGYIH